MRQFLIASLVLVLGAVLAANAVAAIATNPNQLFGSQTPTFKLTNFENIYDSSGNIVTGVSAVAGDTLQGVFAITQVQNGSGAQYDQGSAGTGVELTGVFDELVVGTDSAGNYILVPDTTSVVGQKAISGSAFQSQFGTGAMIGVYYNNTDNMPVLNSTLGLSLTNSAASAAFALAESGTEWASFGGTNMVGTNATAYWATQQGVGTDVFTASLGFIQNDTGIPTPQWNLLTQIPAGGSVPANLYQAAIANPFVIQGDITAASVADSNINAIYGDVSQDPAHMDLILPEPTSILVVGGLFGFFGFAACWRRRKARA